MTSGRFAPRWPIRIFRRLDHQDLMHWSDSARCCPWMRRRSPCVGSSTWPKQAGAPRTVVGVLLAIAPAVGHARIVAVAPRLALALGYDVEDREP